MIQGTNGKIQVTQVRLCIDYFDHENIRGNIKGIAIKNPIDFDGLVDFVVKLDLAYNQIGRPQPFNVIRSFQQDQSYQTYQGSPNIYHSDEFIRSQKGKLLSLDLNMLTRKGAEWQGKLHDEAGHFIGDFKTTLECVKLMEESVP